ncbi:MAG: hypothetical protein DRQ62_04905 [Gammaproteobacteria bacterium]|nr:MAG: hypothetical protein DRQ62_04905 [Gammaproteobacteria bacterium]
MTHVFKQQLILTLAFLLFLSALLLSHPASAEEDYGRYRAIVLEEGGKPNSSGSVVPRVFIIDSKEGHMWTLDQKAKLHDLKGTFTLGTILTYQGQVRPGKKMGDIVEQAATW